MNRSLLEHELWLDEPFSKGQAWVDLIGKASFKDSFFFIRGNKINVKRGEVSMSQLTMGGRWKWSRNKVRKFLNDLEKEEMLVQQKTKLTTILTICNYSVYQDGPSEGGKEKVQQRVQQRVQQKGQQKGQQREQQKVQQRVHIKEGKEVKKVKNIYTEKFECFWKEFPAVKRGSKGESFSRWKDIKIPTDFYPDLPKKQRDEKYQDHIIFSIANRRDNDHEFQTDNFKYLQHACRWLKGERWNDVWEKMDGQQNDTGWAELDQHGIHDSEIDLSRIQQRVHEDGNGSSEAVVVDAVG